MIKFQRLFFALLFSVLMIGAAMPAAAQTPPVGPDPTTAPTAAPDPTAAPADPTPSPVQTTPVPVPSPTIAPPVLTPTAAPTQPPQVTPTPALTPVPLLSPTPIPPLSSSSSSSSQSSQQAEAQSVQVPPPSATPAPPGAGTSLTDQLKKQVRNITGAVGIGLVREKPYSYYNESFMSPLASRILEASAILLMIVGFITINMDSLNRSAGMLAGKLKQILPLGSFRKKEISRYELAPSIRV